ncbi:uncharacterized protein LOC142237790 [Haematobia irritans]|uniref:uncharacterized protein LOC142237790 n=1 Tax=Haematobia irritans TaxID=7368 RepID=UPI003F508E34
MKIFITITIVVAVLTQVLAEDSSQKKENENFALILKEVKAVTVAVKSLLAKTLPNLPSNDPEYDLHRKRFQEYLHLYNEYQESSEKECSGEKALKFYDAHNSFLHLYMWGHLKESKSQEVLQLLNDNGLQDVVQMNEEKRKQHNFDNVNWKQFEQYVAAGHC